MKFKKGQKVYYASTNFGYIYTNKDKPDIKILTVVERTVDSCGKKQMTFYDFGYDLVFHRTTYAPYDVYFTTRYAAYEFLKHYKKERDDEKIYHEILVGEYTDKDRKVFDEYHKLYPELHLKD